MPAMVVVPNGSRHTRHVAVDEVSKTITYRFTCRTALTYSRSILLSAIASRTAFVLLSLDGFMWSVHTMLILPF